MSTLKIGDTFCVIASPPGAVASQKCPVCGEEMIMTAYPDTERYRGLAAGIMGLTVPHDEFRCGNSSFSWHDHAQRLWHDVQTTESIRVRTLIEADLEDLIRVNRPDLAKGNKQGEVSDGQA